MLFLFLLITSFSCARMPPHMKAGYTSINKHIEKMENSEHWMKEAIGGSFYDGDIKLLTVSFIVLSDNFNIEQARSLMVKGVETFLTSINMNDQLIPHLNHYPFTYQDIDYSISLYTPERKWLGFVLLVKDRLCFYKTKEFITYESPQTEKVHEEPYTEALQKVNAGLAMPVLQSQAL